MKPLQIKFKHMLMLDIFRILAGNELLPPRFAGVCTPGAPDRTAFHSNRSYGYAFRSKAARSNTPGAHPSGSFMQHSG